MRVEVEVTQQDIDEGSKCDDQCCPVALALRRALNRDVSVGSTHLLLLNKTLNPLSEMPLPMRVQSFVRQFDTGTDPMCPFKFTLEVPES